MGSAGDRIFPLGWLLFNQLFNPKREGVTMLRNLTWQRLRGPGMSLSSVALLLALVVIGTTLALNPQSAPQIAAGDDKEARKVILDAFIDMTCLPTVILEPVILDQPPPCGGLTEPYSSPTPSGRAHLIVKDDDTVQLNIKLKGIAPGQTITAWFIWYFQFLYPFLEGGEALARHLCLRRSKPRYSRHAQFRNPPQCLGSFCRSGAFDTPGPDGRWVHRGSWP